MFGANRQDWLRIARIAGEECMNDYCQQLSSLTFPSGITVSG